VSLRRRHLAIGFAAAALLAGCGNDDPIEPVSASTSSTEAGTLSQQEFITSADARCAESNAALANLSTDSSAASSTVSQERSITQGLLTSLQGIGDAEDPDGSLADYYTALKKEVSILKQQEDAIASGDTAGADALDSDLATAKSDASSAADQYGFKECGQEGTALPESGTTTSSAAPTTTSAAPATTTAAPTTTTPVTPAPVTPATPPATGGTSSGGTSPSTGGTGTGGTGSSGGTSSGGGSGGFSP
jgi:hypothetical protein